MKIEDDFSDIYENALFVTAQDKADLVADKSRVARAFLFNFFGMLGMVNATQPAQKTIVLNFLKQDKKLRIDTIDDSNHDISLSLKLASEAGFFINTTTVNEITRFLVKLKAGQISHVDSAVVGKWAVGLKPDFHLHLTDQPMRLAFLEFKQDEGKTIDISRLAVTLKSRVNRIGDGGDYQRFAKRFHGLTEIKPTVTTPAMATTTAVVPAAPSMPATAPAAPSAPVKLNYYQRQKLKKQAAAGGVAAPAVTAPAGAKLSYYQRQKLKKQAATASTQADLAAQAAIAKAAADELAAVAALKAKEEEENRKAQAAAVKSMPRAHFDILVDKTIRPGYGLSGMYITPGYLKNMFNFDIVPDIYIQVADLLTTAVSYLHSITNYGDTPHINSMITNFRSSAKEIEKLSGYLITIPSYIEQILIKNKSGPGLYRLVFASIIDGQPVDEEFFTKVIDQLPLDSGIIDLISMFGADAPALDQLAKLIATNDARLANMWVRGFPIHALFLGVKQNWGGSGPAYSYSGSYGTNILSFGIKLLKAANRPFEDFINEVDKYNTYGNTNDVFFAYGRDPAAEVGNIDPSDAKYMRDYISYFLKNKFASLKEAIVKQLLRQLPGNQVYSPSFPLLKALHDEFAQDIITNGYTASKLNQLLKSPITEHYIKNVFKSIGVDLDLLVKNHPNDPASLYMSAVQNGMPSLTPQQLATTILSLPSTASGNVPNIMQATHSMVQASFGDRDHNCNSAALAILEIAKTRPADFNMQRTGESLMAYLPYANQDTVVEWLKFARDSNNKWIMGADLYKSIHKSKKQGYVDILTGIVQDSIGTDVEDYVNDIVENLAPHVIQKMRGNLVGANAVIVELNKGEIKPFDKIDANRLKKIFLYNDLNMGSIVSGQVEKKKKTESYAQYFARASKAIQSTSLLGEAKVKPDTKADAKAINKIMIQRDHAGKHGDTYPKIDKVYDASLEYPEFWDFRKTKFGDGSIVPAYHGTGGIAASMILRYGFKVIQSSDPTVTGRMLGDGIYFSNKIDKVAQYVSNGGYSRQHGQKGYVMEMDTNLGTKNRDYRAAGVGTNDNIRSPEWCVVDPKAQLRITRVYEVTLVSKNTVDKYLAEGVQSTGLKGFRQHLKEQVVEDQGNFTSFVFRDGMIPIVDKNTSTVTYVDFEEALDKNLINQDMFDVSAQGPVIVFRDTEDQVTVDERFAEHMGGDELQLYIQLFRRNMFEQ